MTTEREHLCGGKDVVTPRVRTGSEHVLGRVDADDHLGEAVQRPRGESRPGANVERTARSGEAAGEQFNDQRVEVGPRRRIAAGHDLPAERVLNRRGGVGLLPIRPAMVPHTDCLHSERSRCWWSGMPYTNCAGGSALRPPKAACQGTLSVSRSIVASWEPTVVAKRSR